jgi:8-oxo-dGTP pyrophosphatase MutT (NUDIX family)
MIITTTITEQLITALSRYKTTQEDEHEMLTRIWDLVTTHPNECISRRFYLPGHITASAWVVNADKTKVLLLHHAKLNRWLQPGGHIEQDTHPDQAALRETQEETGLIDVQLHPEIFDVDIHLIPARKHEPDHYHYDIRYLITAINETEARISEESTDMAWIPIREVASYNSDRSIQRMVDKCIPKRRG